MPALPAIGRLSRRRLPAGRAGRGPRLRGWGVEFIDPSSGSLACGEIGPGRLAEPDDIVEELLGRLAASGKAIRNGLARDGSRVLITAGGTKVPIDGVRAITNTSSGTTGADLAAHFARAGYDVTLLHAADAVVPEPTNGSISMHSFTTFDDLAGLLAETLSGGRFDAVIHLAAVSDYEVDHVVIDGTSVTVGTNGKLDTGDVMEIHLKRNPKLLAQLKELGGDALVVVGFKLTNGASIEQRAAAVRGIIGDTDLVVHNDVSEMDEGRHAATIYRATDDDVEVVTTITDNAGLAAELEREIFRLVASR